MNNYRILNFNNIASLKIPKSEEEHRFLMYQTGRFNTPEESFAEIEKFTSDRLRLLFEIFKSLPSESTIIDIGAGNSLVDLALASLFPEKNFKFILVDGGDDDINNLQHISQYNENGYSTYNNWSFARTVIELNNLPLDNFTFVHPNDFKECNAEVIMSFSSLGWHYPLETYLDIITAGLNKNGYLSLQPFVNTDNAVDKLNGRFGKAIKLSPMKFNEDSFSPRERRLILEQIELGKLHRDPFAFHGTWQRK